MKIRLHIELLTGEPIFTVDVDRRTLHRLTRDEPENWFGRHRSSDFDDSVELMMCVFHDRYNRHSVHR